MRFTRGEGATLVVLGVIFAAGGLLASRVINFDGVTLAAFYFAVALGAFMVVLGLIALTGVLDRGSR